MDHAKDTLIACIAAILMWKLPVLGFPITEQTAHELAVGVLWLLGKLQKSPVPSLAPVTETTVKTITTSPPPPVS